MDLVDLKIVDIIMQNKNFRKNEVDNHSIIFALDNVEVKVCDKSYKLDSNKLLFIEQHQEIQVLSKTAAYFIVGFKGELVSKLFNLDIIQKKDIGLLHILK